MKKKILSLFLSMLMIISIMPTSVFAYLGHIDDAKERDEIPTTSSSWDAYGIDAYLQNSYLDLELQALDKVDRPNQKSNYYVKMKLRPTYQYENGKDDPNAFMNDSFEINRYGFYNYELNVDKIELSKIGDINDPNSKYGIQAVYTLSDTQWNDQKRKALGNLRDVKETMKAVVTYYFIRLGNGGHDSIIDLPLSGDSVIPSKETYAVKIECKLYYKGYDFSDFFINPEIGEEHLFDESNLRKTSFKNKTLLGVDSVGGIQIKWISGLSDFATWGHTENEKSKATLMADIMTSAYFGWGGGQLLQTTQDISLGLKEESNVMEVYTNCYGAFNPFVCLSGWCNSGMSEYDYIYLDSTTSFDSKSNMLKVTSASEFFDSSSPYLDESGYSVSTMHRIIGYRDMFENSHESSQISTNPDEVTIRKDAGQVGIFKDSRTGFTAQSVINGTALADLKNKYGDPVALIRGDYEKINGDFIFKYNGKKPTDSKNRLMAAALSESVIATWGSDGKLVVKSNGTITGTNISLSTPKFKLYKPKKSSNIEITPSTTGLSMNIDPGNNDAVHTTNIPHTTVRISSLSIAPDGSIVLNGTLTVGNLFGNGMSFLNTKIGYGFKGNQFGLNGIQGKGELKSPRIGSLKLLNLKGEINTFNGQELYDFSANINIFEKIQANAEITLKRNIKTGELVPNKVYADLGIQTPGFTGFPLVAPVPVANITGGGIGFDNLADTINGNWQLIPPFTLKGTVYGNVVGLVGGKLVLEIGPSKLGINGEQIKLLGTTDPNYSEIFRKLGLNVSITGETRYFTPKDQSQMEFTGLNFSGKLEAEMAIPKDSQVIGINASIGIHGFGGVTEESDWFYMDIGGNTKASAKLRTPKDWKLGTGGKEIASVGTEIALGMETAMPVNNGLNTALNEAFKNARIYGGVMAQASIIGVGVRVWYIIPSEFDYDVSATGFDDWNWEDHGVHVAKLYNSQNLQVGLMSVENDIQSFKQQPLLQTMSNNTSSVTIPAGQTDEAVLVSFVIGDTANKEAFQNGLVLRDGNNNPISVEWMTYDSTGDVITNADTATAMWRDVSDDNGNNKQMAIINIGNQPSGSTITIENGSGIEFTTEFASVSPLTDFTATLAQQDDTITITPTVINPESEKEYVIRTWLGNEKGASDYILGLNNYNGNIDFDLTGSIAPTGEYYVTSVLMEKVTGEFDGTHDGEETAYVPIKRVEFDGKVAYTNNVQPSAPSTVNLKAIGNEAMNASWSSVDNSDGYLVKIYNADGTDTGCEYLYNSADFSDTLGLKFNNGTYSIDMAPTGSGVLEADKEYIIGVSAVKYLSIESDGTLSCPVIGTEKRSTAVNLPKHEDLDLEILLNYITISQNSETALYEGSVNNGFPDDCIGVNVPENSNAQVTITRMDNNEPLTSFYGTELFTVPEFDGSIMLQVVASVTQNGITEQTTCNVLITRDDIAPVLTLDSNIVYADGEDAHFTVTGTAEPGAIVTVSDNSRYQPEEYQATAGTDGKFAVSGSGVYNDRIFVVYATDEANNVSESLTVFVNSHSEFEVTVNDSYAENSGEGFYYNESTVTVNAGTRDGYVFVGWSSPDVTLEDETNPTVSFSMPTENVSITAIWAESKTVTFDSNGYGIAPNAINVAVGEIIEKPTDPTASCYAFGGWYKETACETPWNFESDTVNDDITLFAKWTFTSHTDENNDGKCDNCQADVDVGNEEPNSFIDNLLNFIRLVHRWLIDVHNKVWFFLKNLFQ